MQLRARVRESEGAVGVRGGDCTSANVPATGQGVDTLGLLLAVWVTAASVSDNTGGIHLLSCIAKAHPRITKAWADTGYRTKTIDHGAILGIDVEATRRDPGQKGFKLIPAQHRDRSVPSSQGGGAPEYWTYLGAPTTRRGAVPDDAGLGAPPSGSWGSKIRKRRPRGAGSARRRTAGLSAEAAFSGRPDGPHAQAYSGCTLPNLTKGDCHGVSIRRSRQPAAHVRRRGVPCLRARSDPRGLIRTRLRTPPPAAGGGLGSLRTRDAAFRRRHRGAGTWVRRAAACPFEHHGDGRDGVEHHAADAVGGRSRLTRRPQPASPGSPSPPKGHPIIYAYDRELAAWAAMLSPVDHSDPDSAREQVRQAQYQQPLRSVPEDLWIAEVDVPGPVGAPAVPVRVYAPVRPADPWAAAPAVLYFHGGGFVTGDLETGHDECVWTATALGVVVVNVAYRLAPQHPYPHALMDAHAVLYWLSTQGESLGIDPHRIAVVGEDAGAGIAASLCLLARERTGVRPCFQLLADPLLDDRLASPSAELFVDTPVLDRVQAANMWFHYVGAAAGGPHVSPYAAPGRADDLAGLPPTHLSVCEFDPARDEGIAYAERLIRSGVSAELHHYPGTFHGCASVPGAAVALRMREDRIRALHRALFTPPPRPVPAHEPPAGLATAPLT